MKPELRYLIKNNHPFQRLMKRLCLTFRVSSLIIFAVVLIIYISKVQGCGSRQFTCDNGACIPISWQCDDENDCEDGSDEKDCSIKSCTSNQFKCVNSKCISASRICDDVDDCNDGSDEINCDKHNCTHLQFNCGQDRNVFHCLISVMEKSIALMDQMKMHICVQPIVLLLNLNANLV